MKSLGNGHRCVMHMLGCMTRADGILGLVLEYCPNGTLLEHVRSSKRQGMEMRVDGENREMADEGFDDMQQSKFDKKLMQFAWQICSGMVREIMFVVTIS